MNTDHPATKRHATAMEPLSLRGYQELPLLALKDYPALTVCHQAWVAAQSGRGLPAVIEVETLPPEVMPYTMLLDYLPDEADVRVRIAGLYVGERSNQAGGGRRLRNFFSEDDARIVFASMRRVAETKLPSLARRSYVALNGTQYTYVRLILPLSLDGNTVTGFFKTIEPETLVTQPA
ncbi:hypothetical protein [Ferrovibrio sp.]|uniref:hypothetical protein n=1 Tax=Ferrovibrio sp. TaxID=1917215 RepID=UPI003D103E4A